MACRASRDEDEPHAAHGHSSQQHRGSSGAHVPLEAGSSAAGDSDNSTHGTSSEQQVADEQRQPSAAEAQQESPRAAHGDVRQAEHEERQDEQQPADRTKARAELKKLVASTQKQFDQVGRFHPGLVFGCAQLHLEQWRRPDFNCVGVGSSTRRPRAWASWRRSCVRCSAT